MIRLLLILLIMAFPAYIDNGGIAAATGGAASIDVPYMGTINANNILFVQVLDAADDSFSTPSGWAKVNDHTGVANLSDALFWKRATGSETGTETFTSSAGSGQLIAGIMSRYSGCITSGTPYEGLQSEGIVDTDTVIVPAVTTSDDERLVVNFIQEENDNTITTAADYTLAFSEFTLVGSDCRFMVQYQEVATATTTTARTSTIDARDEYWGCFSIALLPIAGDVDVLTSTDIESQNVDIDTPTIGQEHALTGNNVETQNSEVVNATLGQEHVLSSDNILAQNPVIGTPTLQEVDVLEADNIAAQNPIIEDSDIGQEHVLDSNIIESQDPIVENVTIGQIHVLLSEIIEAQNPVIENATLGQEHSLASNDIESQNVVIGTPTLAEVINVDNLVATDIETAAPIIQLAILGQIHDLLADDITSGNPIISNPIMDETVYLPFIKRKVCENKIVATFIPSISRKTCENKIAATFSPFINRIRCTPLEGTKIYNLAVNSINSGNPVIENAIISQVHILNTTNIETQNVVIGSPELGGFVAEYQAVYDSWTAKPSESVANAQNTMTESLVNDGIWAELDVFYVFAAHTNDNGEALTNWINPGTFDASIVLNGGTLNYTTFEGVQSSDSAHVNTNWNAFNDAINYTLNSASMGTYSRTNNNLSEIEFGVDAASNSILALNWGDNVIGSINAGASDVGANGNSLGMFVISRPDSANTQAWGNKISLYNNPEASTSVTNGDIIVLGRLLSGIFNRPSTKQLSMYFAGSSFNQTNVNDFTDAFEAYMDSNGKGVIP